MWRAALKLGDRSLPVKLYAAVQDRRVRFHLVHSKDRTRVVQKMVNPATGEAVPSGEIKKGFEVERGLFVEITPEELNRFAPKPSRDVTIEQLLPRGTLAPHWFDRPYYLGPDGAIREYAALAKALSASDREGLARWVMRGRRYVGVLHPRDGGLCLITLHSQGEVVDLGRLDAPHGRPADARELALAEQLVDSLRGELDLTQFRDEHRARIEELIERKARGEHVSRRVKEKPETQTSALAEQLRASLPRSSRLKPLKAARGRGTRSKERRSA